MCFQKKLPLSLLSSLKSTTNIRACYFSLEKTALTSPSTLSKLASGIKETAVGVMEIFPGSTGRRKLLILGSATTITTWLVANEWYIVNNETTPTVISLALFVWLYKVLSEPFIKFVRDAEKKEMDMFVGTYNQFMKETKDTIAHNEILMHSEEIITEYHNILKENLEMLREIEKLKGKVTIIKDANDQLKTLYKKEQQQIYTQKKERANNLTRMLLEELKTPEMVSSF